MKFLQYLITSTHDWIVFVFYLLILMILHDGIYWELTIYTADLGDRLKFYFLLEVLVTRILCTKLYSVQ